MDIYFNVLEIILFFLAFPFFLKLFQAIDFSQLFRKGFTGNIQIIFVAFVFIFSYYLTHAFVEVLKLFYFVVN